MENRIFVNFNFAKDEDVRAEAVKDWMLPNDTNDNDNELFGIL